LGSAPAAFSRSRLRFAQILAGENYHHRRTPPIKNIHRQLSLITLFRLQAFIHSSKNRAEIANVERTCNSQAIARAPRSHSLRDERNPRPKTPTDPRPVIKRAIVENPRRRLKKLKAGKGRVDQNVIVSIRARRILSPSAPKIMPPMPHPHQEPSRHDFTKAGQLICGVPCISETSAGIRASEKSR